MFEKRVGAFRFSAVAVALIMCLSMAVVAGDSEKGESAAYAASSSDNYARVGWLGAVYNWNPLAIELTEDYVVCYLIHSSLYTYDQDWGGPVNDLAVGSPIYTVHPNGSMTTTITITDNAYFRNAGNIEDLSHPLTADDVAFTLNTVKQNLGGAFDWFLHEVSDIRMLDTYTVSMWTPYLKATLIDDLAGIPILPKYVYEDMADPLSSMRPEDLVGSGPFVFESMLKDVWYKFGTAPNYHGAADYPGVRDVSDNLDGIIYTVYSDMPSLCLAMNAGVEDTVVVTGDVPSFTNILGNGASVNVFKAAVQESGICDIAINAIPPSFRTTRYGDGNPHLLDPAVRQAVLMTLDKDYICDTLLRGLVVQADSVVQPGYWHADIEDEIQFDPAAARDLLIQNGYADLDGDGYLQATADAYVVREGLLPFGSELTGIRCQAPDTDSTYGLITMAWQGWAQEAGIGLVSTIESEVVMINQAWYQADYDIWVWHWGWGSEPLGGALSVWLTSELGPGGDNCQMPMGPWWYDASNYSEAPDEWGLTGPYSAYDQNFTLALETLDREDRKAIVDKLQQWIYDSHTESPPYYDLGLYAFTDVRFVGWGDWEQHPGRSVTSGLLWLWFDLAPREENLPPVFNTPLLPSYQATVGEEIVFEIVVSDPDGDPLLVNWSFGDGDVVVTEIFGTSSPTMVQQSHVYSASASGLELWVTLHDMVQGHQVLSLSTVDVVDDQSNGRTAGYVWHNMFNEPFGEWWDWRYDYYGNWQIISDTYPYIYRTLGPGGVDAYYSNMRLNVMTDDLPEVNMNDHPQFLPYLGDERGGTAVVDWYMQYLTEEEMERYPDNTAAWLDGWVIGLNGTVTLDRTAAMAVMGITSEGFDDFDTWWTANQVGFLNDYIDWILYEGNDRLDIFCAYEYALTPLSFNIDAEKVGDEIVLTYDTVTWGMEVLMTRWMKDSFMPVEWYFEDFSMHAEISPDMADIDIDTSVVGAVFAKKDVVTEQLSWAWRGMLQDYVPSSSAHPYSDFDTYADLEYVDMYAGSSRYGDMIPFEYTPGAFNLLEWEEMSIEWPSGAQTFVVDGGLDWLSTGEYGMTSPYSEPSEYDLPSNIEVDTAMRIITFEGPMDVCSWSETQTAHDYLESEWDRLGVLPYGMPWIEFRAATEPPEPVAMVIGELPESVRVNETIGFTVTVVNQYGGPYEDYTGTVMFSSSDTLACLPEYYTFVAADEGSHYFEATFFTEGEQALTVSDTTDPMLQTTEWTHVLPLAQGKRWTVMAYLDADNNLEDVGLVDFCEMASVGSTDDVDIIVQFDRATGYDPDYGDWTDTKRFYVTQGMTPYASNAVMDLGELNMGDPETLADFVSWGTANYPAENYMLVLWDHGGGWDGAVCWDETNGYDALTMDEVETALATGEHIDILGYDACLMAMAEVVYETKEYVDYVVASEETVPWDGWPYDTIMGDLAGDPMMTPAELSTSIVNRYMEFYGTHGIETISAVDVAAAEDMFNAIDVFAQELMNALPEHEDVIQYCRMNSTVFFDGTFLDLYDFAYEVGDYYTTPELLAAADALWAAVDAAVVAEGHADYYWDAHGISIYFPESASWYWEQYEDVLDFTADTSWDEFLMQYLSSDPDTYEPDDVYTDATELVDEVTQTHSLHTVDDADWYTFILADEDDVRIVTQGTWGQYGGSIMWLFDEAGVPYSAIAYDEGWGYGYWASIDAHLGPGTYYVQVGPYYLTDGYDITLYVGDIPNQPPLLYFDIYSWPVAGVPSTYDASYSYDPDGWIVSYFWDFGDGTTANEAIVEHTYEEAGIYWLIVTIVDDDGASATIEFDLYVEEGAEPDAYEPDDTYDQATVIELGETQEHSIAPGGGDVDWVTFTLSEQTDVEVRTSANDTYWADTMIALYDEEGVPFSPIAVDDDSGGGLTSRILMSLPAGTYWVEVWSFYHYGEIQLYYLSLTETEIVNQPPVASLYWWPSEPAPGYETYFDAWGSYDPDGWITDWIWDFGDNSTSEGEWVNHTFDEVGEYFVTLTVIDNYGAVGSASALIWVHENAEPVASLTFSPLSPGPGETVYFDAGESYDPDGWIEYYVFEFGDGTAEGGPWPETWHTYYNEGVYTVTLTVYDSSWVSNSISVEVRVGGEAAPPVAIIGYDLPLPLVGETVTFDASHSFDPDGSIVMYVWQFGDGEVAEGMTATHAYEHEGVYDVKLTVMDGDMLVDEDIVSITVASVPEPAMVYSPLAPDEGELVTFYAYGSYDEGGIVEYVWSFGDGTYAIGWDVAHVYLEHGDYDVTLTLTNIYGIQTSLTQTIEVGKGDSGVKGAVMSEKLRPVKNAVVEVRTSNGVLMGSTLTDSKGEFMIKGLAAGVYDLTISKNGYQEFTVSITISDGVLDIGTVVLLEDGGGGKSLAASGGESLWLAGAAGLICLAMLGGLTVVRRKGQ